MYVYVLLLHVHTDESPAFVPILNAATVQASAEESRPEDDPVAVPVYVPVYEHSTSVPEHELPYIDEQDLDAEGTL